MIFALLNYIDIHTHQTSFHTEDIIIQNEIVLGTIRDVRIATQQESVFYSLGIHPWYINNVTEQLEQLKALVRLPHVVAIGEAGLDKLAEAPLSLQEEVFRAQVRLSEEIQKPLIIHCVKAWDELIAVRKQMKPAMSWIIHGFRGNGVLAEQLVKQGFYLSFGDRFNSEAVRVAWPNRILTETDDREVDIREVYRLLATTLLLDEEIFASQIEKNTTCLLLNK